MSKKLGKLVKDARAAKDLSQAALAEIVDGLSAGDVGKIERGEKEPEVAVLKAMAKPLGLTQAALFEAASAATKKAAGYESSAAKTASKTAGKTSSSAKTASKTAAKKTSSSKTSSDADLKLTATEKKLVQLYRKADSSTKKAAMGLLSGSTSPLDLVGSLLAASSKTDSSKKESSMVEELLGSLLGGGKTGSSAASKDAMTSLLEGILGKS